MGESPVEPGEKYGHVVARIVVARRRFTIDVFPLLRLTERRAVHTISFLRVRHRAARTAISPLLITRQTLDEDSQHCPSGSVCPPRSPRPHDAICHTRTPAAPGADATAAGSPPPRRASASRYRATSSSRSRFPCSSFQGSPRPRHPGKNGAPLRRPGAGFLPRSDVLPRLALRHPRHVDCIAPKSREFSATRRNGEIA